MTLDRDTEVVEGVTEGPLQAELRFGGTDASRSMLLCLGEDWDEWTPSMRLSEG